MADSNYFIEGNNKIKLYIQEIGRGEPVILLAGGPGLNPAYLLPVCKKISKKFRCILLHQRGSGKSELKVVTKSNMTMQSYALDLEALRKHLKQEKLTLIGHSWGGMLSLDYATKFPERLKKIILLGSGGPTSEYFKYFSDNIHMRLNKQDWTEVHRLSKQKKSTLSAIIPGYFYHRNKAIEFKNHFSKLGPNEQPGVFSLTMTNYISNQEKRVQLLTKFKGKVFLIQGRQDPIGESTLFQIRDLLPQSKVLFIERCGHFPWFEKNKQREACYNYLHIAITN